MSDDSNTSDPKPKTSPAVRLGELARDGELERRMAEILSEHDGQSINDIKTHIDDVMQIILEAIDQKLPIVEESKNKKIEFYVGLGIGLSLLVGLIAGLLMRGIL